MIQNYWFIIPYIVNRRYLKKIIEILGKTNIRKFMRDLEEYKRFLLKDYKKIIESLDKEVANYYDYIRSIQVINIFNKKYPEKLRRIPNPPLALFVMGKLIVNRKVIGVIGPRKASVKGLKLSYEVASLLAKKNFIIINGLALGIDTQAIMGALDNNGRVICVLPWLFPLTPKSNEKIARKILEHSGVLISEYPLKPSWVSNTTLKRYFILRNRIIAALSDALVVIEIAESSKGTINCIKYARKYRRKIFYLERGRLSNSIQEIISRYKISVVEDIESLISLLSTV